MGFNQHQHKEYLAQLDRDFDVINRLLQTPMTLEQIKQKVSIPIIQKKLTQWALDGKINRYKNEWTYVYESIGKKPEINPFSRIVKPMDSTKYNEQMALYRKTTKHYFASSNSFNHL